MLVQGLLAPLTARAPPLAGDVLRSALASVEATMRDYVLLRDPLVQPELR